MIEAEMLAVVTQLGAAGLMGAMWLTERRGAAQREQQLTGAHERIMQQQKHLDVLVRVLEDNTRALISLESNQRELAGVLARMDRDHEHERERERADVSTGTSASDRPSAERDPSKRRGRAIAG